MRRIAGGAAVLVVLALAAGGAAASPPAGATAQCRDGTYSYSQHHSGTCSHHGGVSAWLDGSASVRASGAASVGATVLLGQRTRTGGCRLGANPDPRCSPGAYYTGLSKAALCSPAFHTSTIRNVPQSEKYAVEQAYGLAARLYGRTLEIDHIVSLELGGSNDIANLYPETADAQPGYHVKDRLENKLHALVCSGAMSLRAAQTGIARDWQAVYAQVYGAPAVG